MASLVGNGVQASQPSRQAGQCDRGVLTPDLEARREIPARQVEHPEARRRRAQPWGLADDRLVSPQIHRIQYASRTVGDQAPPGGEVAHGEL